MKTKRTTTNSWPFVTASTDQAGMVAIQELEKMGYSTRVLENGDLAHPGEIAIFYMGNSEQVNQIAGSSGKWMRVAAHKLKPLAPKWARETTLHVGIRCLPNGKDKNGFSEAMRTLGQAYEKWFPDVQKGFVAPWGQLPGNEEKLSLFQSWFQQTVFDTNGQLTPARVLSLHGVYSVYGRNQLEKWESATSKEIMIMGCVHLNKTRTDVVDQLDPEKRTVVVERISSLVTALKETGAVNRLVFVFANEEMVENQLLLASLNPLMWSDLRDTPSFDPSIKYRRNGNNGPVSKEELAEMLSHNASLIRGVAEDIAEKTGIEIEFRSWNDVVLPFIKEATAICREHSSLVEEIYDRRATSYPSYKRVQAELGRKAGLLRAKSNAPIYVATAMYGAWNRGTVIVDTEYDTQWVQELEPAMEIVWEAYKREAIHLFLPAHVRQPWG